MSLSACLSPRLASPRLASPRLASPRLASPRLASPRLASPCLALPCLCPSSTLDLPFPHCPMPFPCLSTALQAPLRSPSSPSSCLSLPFPSLPRNILTESADICARLVVYIRVQCCPHPHRPTLNAPGSQCLDQQFA